MITAIDFGSYAIRSAWRTDGVGAPIRLCTERSQYCVLPDQDVFRESLESRSIPYAACDQTLVVFGNRADSVRWLSRQPCAPLFDEGRIPTQDAPARQILNVLTRAMLPRPTSPDAKCYYTIPGGRSKAQNTEFLSRLIRMQGYVPCSLTSAETVMLAAGVDTAFTGVTVVMGAECCEVSVCRHGNLLSLETVDVGANWMDTELAKQFRFRMWDSEGECYLDLDAVREWKHSGRLHLRSGVGEREKLLGRLYGTVLDRVCRAIRQLLSLPLVKRSLGSERLTILCAGGPTQVKGFAGMLTERLVDHEIAGDIVAVRIVDNPDSAVVRGLLIQGELERQMSRGTRAA
ncbi:MAG: hypothetical protein R3C49_23555 [Planctomycetaceae bacterium]